MPQPRKYESQAERQAAYTKRDKVARQAHLQQRGLPALPKIATIPGTARWNAALSSAHKLVECVSREMIQYHADRTDGWRKSPRAEMFEQRQIAIEAVLRDLALLRGSYTELG